MSADTIATDQISDEPRRSPWLNAKLLTAVGVLVIAVGFLIYNAMDGSAAYYMTVEELATSSSEVQGQQVRVGGDVADGSIVRSGIGEPIRFDISDGTHTVPIVYDGAVPDIFSDHAEVIATGTVGEDGVFVADELLTKCPSRFESEEGVSK